MVMIIPKDYKCELGVLETQKAIKELKDFFQTSLSEELNLIRVSSPLFVLPESGTNDNLNGIEKPVSFDVPFLNKKAEIVQSLAKWKRVAIKKYGIEVGQGIYADMNAIRKDEELDNVHSLYVDQWDWEYRINKSDRSNEKLEWIVKKIYKVFKKTDDFVVEKYPNLKPLLPEEIVFITSQELEDEWPNLTPKQREREIVKRHKAVFLTGIGKSLESGEKHDGRSPDYDDWNLNGDFLFYNPVLDDVIELSSMGIRVDEDVLEEQLILAGAEDRKALDYHRELLDGNLPYTIGGGIGQSRICMFFLRKAHIGEVQVGIWPKRMIEECKKASIHLL
ncbi:aspartate--ammonia ligase [Peptostreptococcus equinus]|uniref:Aspartate--ammonia ligase n=1 Tax=Peptostreptococcus equinus TaxID=3003601 RepID=A0ABY7JQF6_9FIRM|nr:aspartate--ammonia ligase [Peptostreptococcus sp. CBA3647]WAW15582.1 aspartate--ammonia ligase [Peptostreptococcus sp. CBA3647]